MATTTDQPVALRGDEDQLYRTHARTLRSVVRMKVNTSDDIVEDACAFAWMQLVRCQPRRNTAFAWLRTVAVREAVRLDRIERKHTAADRDGLEHHALQDPRADPDLRDEIIDALDALGALGERQRMILGLHAVGLHHAEIAKSIGCSCTNVARRVARARRAVLARRSGES
jgi:RNA polymerase sigma factor (sigma-70 family)